MPQKVIFILSLISSMIICMSTNSFLGIWMSMEINLFSFIPLISMNNMMNSEKSTTLYFLIQSISSTIILFSMIYMNLTIYLKDFMIMILLMGMFMKLSLFPFHFWMISMLEGLTWDLCFILMTIQKIIPLFSMMLIINKKIIIILCILNSCLSSINGMSMFSMRKIMGFSSMNNLSLILISLMMSKKMFKIYFFIYVLMTLMCTKMFKVYNINFLFQTMNMYKYNKINNLNMLMVILSMAGIPPFLGFMPKLLMVMKMIELNMIFLSAMIMIFNTLATYFYIRISFTNLMMNLNMSKVKKNKNKMKFPMFILITPMTIFL
uniref:NADH dehydrogenase subunit 2 n=1 Tax=Ctenothrips transeolineae TaxID=3045420 RepID=UPI0030E28CC8